MNLSFGDLVTTQDFREFAVLLSNPSSFHSIEKDEYFIGLDMEKGHVEKLSLSFVSQVEPGAGLKKIGEKFGILSSYVNIF